MSRERVKWLKPFLSVMIVISSLLVVVFFKMEVRRMGYAVWKQSRSLEKVREEHQRLSIRAVEKLSPDRIHHLASVTMNLEAQRTAGQVVLMSQEKIAVRLKQ